MQEECHFQERDFVVLRGPHAHVLRLALQPAQHARPEIPTPLWWSPAPGTASKRASTAAPWVSGFKGLEDNIVILVALTDIETNR